MLKILNIMEERNDTGTIKLPLIRKICYSLGHSINGSLNTYTFSYLVVFTKIGLKLDLIYAGYFMLASQIANAIVSPIAGILSDKYNGCCCCGKRKSWYIFAVLFRIVGFSLMFCVPWEEDGYPDSIRFYYYLPMIIINGGAIGAIHTPHLAILTDISQIPLERVQLAGWRNAVGIFSNIYLYVMAWILLYINKGTNDESVLSEDDAPAFRYLALSAVAFGMLCSAAFCIIVKEEHNNTCMSTRCALKSHKQEVTVSVIENNNACFESEENEKDIEAIHTSDVEEVTPNITGTNGCCHSNHVSINNSNGIVKIANVSQNGHLDNVANSIQSDHRRCEDTSEYGGETREIISLKTFLKEPKLYVVASIYMCGKVGVVVAKSYIPLYVNTSLGMDKVSVAVMPLLISISGFLASFVMRKAVKRFGEKWVFVIGETVSGLACVWIYFITQDSFQQIYGASILFGAGQATIHVTSLAMIADLIDTNTWYMYIYLKHVGATIFGIMGFVGKMAQGISFVILQNYNPCGDTVTEECMMFYKVAMVSVLIAMALVSFLVLFTYVAVCRTFDKRSAITMSVELPSPSFNVT